ncbi:radical SAM protein [Candidatus Pacearchaeota archaeon]|nr:radical SAM protein [Candidatus Pacearchaeota archaeon]
MSEKILFRQERNGGYKFNRETGKVEFLEDDKFNNEIQEFKKRNEGLDIISLPENSSEISLSAPLVIWHETTHACNLNCKECVRDKGHEKELNAEEISQIYADLASSGVFEIRVTGGEACLRPDIEKIVHAAKKNGLYVSLTSNGVYSSELRNKIVNLPIELYILSLDGTEQIHDSIRGKGSYSSTMDTIKALTQAHKNVRINTVLMQENKDCIEELVKILNCNGVSKLTLIPLRPWGSAVKDFHKNKLTPEQYMNVVKEVNELRKKYPGFSIATNYDIISTTNHGSNVPSHWSKMCMAGIEAACISPSGNLRACIVASGEGFNVGNLTQSKLSTLWHNDKIWGIFRDIDRRVLEQCKKCPDYTTKCPGSCIAMTEFSKSPQEMYCFKHLVA